jgi:anion-transporting  ArsA/GET3 family ATPase
LTYLEDTLSRKVIFFTGKGGVGKTSLCAATALLAKNQGKKVALMSWDPSAENHPPALATALGIDWIGLETLSAFREYVLQIIRSGRLYDSLLDSQVLRTFVRAAPGLADAVVAGKIWDVYSKQRYDLLVVDLPSSGHSISFFKSPLGLKRIFKSGFIARDTDRVCALFSSPECRLDLIALPEELPLVECKELKTTLESLHPFSFGFLYLNQVFPAWLKTEPQEYDDLRICLSMLNQRIAEQEATFPLAEEIGLPVLKVPRFVETESVKNIAEMAHFLGTQ